MDQIREQLRSFVANNFLFDDDQNLLDSTSFLGTGIIDSTGILELISFLEKTYSITVKDDELIPENLDSIGNVLGFLQRKLPAGE